ncbi:hypothetical protein MMSP_4259 [Mycobacterium sp. 012931]|nr:hypothetical protein MMSP_4259 [Mycobacterium sp. 012931]
MVDEQPTKTPDAGTARTISTAKNKARIAPGVSDAGPDAQ